VLYVKKYILVLLITLSACATNPPPEESEDGSSGPTVYGQLSVSIDYISVE
jgi:hypothetical protein